MSGLSLFSYTKGSSYILFPKGTGLAVLYFPIDILTFVFELAQLAMPKGMVGTKANAMVLLWSMGEVLGP